MSKPQPVPCPVCGRSPVCGSQKKDAHSWFGTVQCRDCTAPRKPGAWDVGPTREGAILAAVGRWNKSFTKEDKP